MIRKLQILFALLAMLTLSQYTNAAQGKDIIIKFRNSTKFPLIVQQANKIDWGSKWSMDKGNPIQPGNTLVKILTRTNPSSASAKSSLSVAVRPAPPYKANRTSFFTIIVVHGAGTGGAHKTSIDELDISYSGKTITVGLQGAADAEKVTIGAVSATLKRSSDKKSAIFDITYRDIQ